MRYVLISAVVAAVAAAWVSAVPDPGRMAATFPAPTVSPYVPATPVRTVHLRPAPVEHASAYLEMSVNYLGLETLAYPDELDTAFEVRQTAREVRQVSKTTRRRTPNHIVPADIEALVRTDFNEVDVQRAINVIFCESRFDANAKNPRSTASGLFQHLEGWWSGAWGVTGVFDPFDPEQSVKAGAALVYGTSSGWGNWNPSRHCWGG